MADEEGFKSPNLSSDKNLINPTPTFISPNGTLVHASPYIENVKENKSLGAIHKTRKSLLKDKFKNTIKNLSHEGESNF